MAYVLINPRDPRTEISETVLSQGPKNSTHTEQHDGEIATPASPNKRSPKFFFSSHNFPSSKKGQFHFLSHILSTSYAFINTHLIRSENTRVCVACGTGKDASVGVILALLGDTSNGQGPLKFVGTSTSCFHSPISFAMPDLEDSGQWSDEGKEETPECVRAEHVDKKSLQTRLEWIIAS